MAGAFSWPAEIQAALSLTYDDGLPVHRTLVGPLLRQHDVRATFYPMIQSDLLLHPDAWRELAAAGNELGNHTVFHPCRQNDASPYAWLDSRYDLSRYSAAQLRSELELASLVLHLLDGQRERSYGNTCCDTTLGPSQQPLEPLLTDLFVAARGSLTNRIAQPAQGLNLYDIGCIDVAGHSLEDLRSIGERTQTTGGWAVLMIHGIGAGTHDLYLDADIHEHFIQWLSQQKAIWTAPVRVVARHIREQQNRRGKSDK